MRPNLKRGFQRIYAVMASGWVITVLVKAQAAYPGVPLRDIIWLRDGGGGYLALIVFPPAIGYALLFGVLPWLVDGFKAEAVKDTSSDGDKKENPPTRI